MPTSPRRQKEAEADGYRTSHRFRLGETQRLGLTPLTQPAWCWAAEAGPGSCVQDGCEGGQAGQGHKPCPDQGDHKDEGPDGEEMDILFEGPDQRWGCGSLSPT